MSRVSRSAVRLLPVIEDAQGEGRIPGLGPGWRPGVSSKVVICSGWGPGRHDHLAVGEIRHPAEREAPAGEGPEVRHLDEVAIAGEVDGGGLVDAHLVGRRHHQIAAAILRPSHVLLGILEREASGCWPCGLEPGHPQRRGVAVVGKPERQGEQPLPFDLTG